MANDQSGKVNGKDNRERNDNYWNQEVHNNSQIFVNGNVHPEQVTEKCYLVGIIGANTTDELRKNPNYVDHYSLYTYDPTILLPIEEKRRVIFEPPINAENLDELAEKVVQKRLGSGKRALVDIATISSSIIRASGAEVREVDDSIKRELYQKMKSYKRKVCWNRK